MVASTTTSPTLGWRSVKATSSGGTSHRAVVPMTPSRTLPVTSSCNEATSAESASNSDWIWRDRRTTISPASVSWPVAAVHEHHCQLLLQPGHVGRHVRLHGVELARRGREAAGVGHGQQGVHLSEIHRSQ